MASLVVAKPPPELELDDEEERLHDQLETLAFFHDIDVFTTRCDRGYLDALAHWHTFFAVVCQPHPAIGSNHPIDLEQQVQCFWTCVLVELAAAASLATRRDDDDYLVSSACADGALAALIAGAIALFGCRAVFVLGGTAGRVRLRDGHAPPPRGWDVAIEFLGGRAFCRSRGGNFAFVVRWLRSAVGWLLSWAVFVLAAMLASQRIVGLSARPLARTFTSWAFAQIAAWLLVEPLGVALFVACVRLVRYAFRRARTVPVVTPTQAVRAAASDADATPLAEATSHVDEKPQPPAEPVLTPDFAQEAKEIRPCTLAEWASRPQLPRRTKAPTPAAAKYQVGAMGA